MRLLSMLAGICITIFALNSYAIQIDVSSHSNKILGLGFTVNGTKHGGMGSSYQASNMPKGNYEFGVRANGKDIPCMTKDGKKKVKLSANTKAKLQFTGKGCTLNIDVATQKNADSNGSTKKNCNG